MPDRQQVLPGDGVSAWTWDLGHGQGEAQEHQYAQTLYLQLATTTRHLHVYGASPLASDTRLNTDEAS